MDMPRVPAQQRDSWFAPLSIDLIVKVMRTTFCHPFLAWIIPLCFRAQVMSWDATPMIIAIAWASLLTFLWIAASIDQRIAYGLPRDVDLGEEVIVVTGGASGLGLLISEVYGMRGASVAVLDVRDMENGEARGVTYYKCDVADPEQVSRVATEIERDLGPPTILINNAAVVSGKPLLDLSPAEIDRTIRTNLLGAFHTLKTFLPSIVRAEGGGTIVTVSSVLGRLGAAGLSDYCASKAGLTALHRSLEAELRASHPHVRAVLVEPGQLSTPLFHGVATPNAFLAPVVEPVDICREVVSAIDAGRGARVAAPLYARWAAWFDVLPSGAQVIARRWAGVDVAMRTFRGRPSSSGDVTAEEQPLQEKNGAAR